MAAYKYAYFLVQSRNRRFDHVHPAGIEAIHSGIFRCHGCGREVAAIEGKPLPPPDDHAHTGGQGTIRWRLAVATQT